MVAVTAPAFLSAAGGVAALLALVLSFVTTGRLARRLAAAALWLALAAVPASVMWDVAFPALDAVGPGPNATSATLLGSAISHVMNYGALAMPVAGIAMVAMRRATIAASRQQRAR